MAASTLRIAIVILNYNGKHLLEQLLPGVVQHSQGQARIIVVDNGSSDGSLSWLKSQPPPVEWIALNKNHGFAEGYNLALRQVEADYYVLLNSDVEVTPGWLIPVVIALQANPEIAAAQPKVLSWKNRTQFEYAGAAGGFMDKNGFVFCRGRMFHTFEEDQGQYNDTREVFWATGCCMFVKADLYHASGGLDADFFAHMEEIDLCWRLKNQGYRVMYYPDSVVYHMGGGTLSKINPRKTYLNFRNNLFILIKNYHGRSLFIKMFFRMGLDGIAFLKFLFEGSGMHAIAVVRAHASFYRSLPAMLKKRKDLTALRHKPNYTGVYNRNVVFDYFLRGKQTFSALPEKYFIRKPSR